MGAQIKMDTFLNEDGTVGYQFERTARLITYSSVTVILLSEMLSKMYS